MNYVQIQMPLGSPVPIEFKFSIPMATLYDRGCKSCPRAVVEAEVKACKISVSCESRTHQ